MNPKTLRIGTRGSLLALQQSNAVKSALEGHWPGLSVTLQIIKTTGDKITDVPLAKVGGKGLFVKEIEDALLAGEVDLVIGEAAQVAMDESEPFTDGIASEWYRRKMVQVFVRRALEKAGG